MRETCLEYVTAPFPDGRTRPIRQPTASVLGVDDLSPGEDRLEGVDEVAPSRRGSMSGRWRTGRRPGPGSGRSAFSSRTKTSGVRSTPRRSASTLPTSLRIGNGSVLSANRPIATGHPAGWRRRRRSRRPAARNRGRARRASGHSPWRAGTRPRGRPGRRPSGRGPRRASARLPGGPGVGTRPRPETRPARPGRARPRRRDTHRDAAGSIGLVRAWLARLVVTLG